VVLELMSVASGLELRRRERVDQPLRFPAAVMGVAIVLSLSAQVVDAERSAIGWIAAAIPALGFLVMVKIALARSTGTGDDSDVEGASVDSSSSAISPGASFPSEEKADADPAVAVLIPAARSAAAALVAQRRRVTVKALRDVLCADGYGPSTGQVAAVLAELKPEFHGETYLTFAAMLAAMTIETKSNKDSHDQAALIEGSEDGRSASAVRLRDHVDWLLSHGILFRGLVLGCAQCQRPAFYRLEELAQSFHCLRCGHLSQLVQHRWRNPHQEPWWFYDLHPVAREFLASDGDVPLLLAKHLRKKTLGVYRDVPEVEVLDANGNAEAEADLIALQRHTLVLGEAKRTDTFENSVKGRRQVAS
jgi:hypothetical protein